MPVRYLKHRVYPLVATRLQSAGHRAVRWYQAFGPSGILFLALLIVGLVAMTYFFLLVRGVFFRNFEMVDLAVLEELHRHRNRTLDILFFVFTTMGDPMYLGGIGVLIALVLAWRRKWWLAGGALSVITGGLLLNLALKEFPRTRPELGLHVVGAHGASFPSGHAMVGLCFWGYLGYLTFRRYPDYFRRVLHFVGVGLLIFLIGLSRPYFGVHFPTDILGGWTAGLGWLLGNIALLEMQRTLGGGTPVKVWRRLRNRSRLAPAHRVEHVPHETDQRRTTPPEEQPVEGSRGLVGT
ncbi:MAG TPA: phosphatase PAP2 family protein [bacterium]|nr:phosphatase PAP2 family protein [bacterium]